MDNEAAAGRMRIEPRQGKDFCELVAIQKTGLTQYGSVEVKMPAGRMRASIGYRRYLDCDKSNTPGQDYAVTRVDEHYLVGVVADGVGQSFFGNLAAEHLCRWLLPELWESRSAPPDEAELEAGLKKAEREFAATVEAYSLEHVVDWHRSALEVTRKAGSQAVFAAFIWDFSRRSGFLYQVGDATALVYRRGRCERIDAPPKGRWSSAGKSQLQLRKTELTDTTAILVKSDGADSAWGTEPERETEAGFLEMANRRATGDDVSFVAGSLVTGAGSPLEERESYLEEPRPAAPKVSVNAAAPLPEVNRQPSLAGPASVAAVKEPEEEPVAVKSRPSRRVWSRLSALVDAGLYFLCGIVVTLLFLTVLHYQESRDRSVQPPGPKDDTASDAVSGTPFVIASPTLPTDLTGQAAPLLSQYRNGTVFRVKAANKQISGLGISGIAATWVTDAASADGDTGRYLFFRAIPVGAEKQVVVHIYFKTGDGRDQDLPVTVDLKPTDRYYQISAP